MDSLGDFVASSKRPMQISLDEFQEIVDLKDALRIEGVMRSHIQRHRMKTADGRWSIPRSNFGLKEFALPTDEKQPSKRLFEGSADGNERGRFTC
mgnify:FL=1